MTRLLNSRRARLAGRRVSAFLTVAAALVVFASVAAAGPPDVATGTYTITGAVVESVRTVGGNTFTTYSSVTGFYAGDLAGPFETPDLVVKTTSDGSVEAHGTLVCTGCTIGGRTGDFTAEISNTSPNAQKMGGIVTVLSATGGLAGLHAVNHFEGTPFFGTYSFRYHFQP